jgi:hypothetical protein
MPIIADKKNYIENKFIKYFVMFNCIGMVISICFIIIIVAVMNPYNQVNRFNLFWFIYALALFPFLGGTIVSIILWVGKGLLLYFAKRTKYIISMPIASFLLLIYTFCGLLALMDYKEDPSVFWVCFIYSFIPLVINAIVIFINRKNSIDSIK